jgi:hypothetical protein
MVHPESHTLLSSISVAKTESEEQRDPTPIHSLSPLASFACFAAGPTMETSRHDKQCEKKNALTTNNARKKRSKKKQASAEAVQRNSET